LFGNKKAEQIQQNGDNFTAQDGAFSQNEVDEAPVNENHNGVCPPTVIFRDGVGTQQTSNGDYEDDGDIGDDENEEVRSNFIIFLKVV
jgi:hypothetical protein